MSTYLSLLTPPTLAAIKADLLAYLQAQSFPVTNWRAGGVERTIVESQAQIVFDFASALASEVVLWVLLDTAEGDALTALCSSNYSTDREPASFEMRYFRLFDDASEGPFSIAVGQLIFSTSDGLLFTNTTGGTIALNGELFVFLKAAEAGAEYAGAPIVELKTPIPGMDFEQIDLISEEIAAQLTSGADEESDERLRQRAKDRWALLGMGSVEAAYERRTLDANSGITRVSVIEDIPDPGKVKVYIAQANGTASGDMVTDAQAALEADDARPLCTTVEVEAATEVPINITATVRVFAPHAVAYEAAVDAALDEFFAGFRISKGDYGSFGNIGVDVVRPTKILNALNDVLDETSVASISALSPSTNTVLDVGQIPVRGTTTITVIEI